MRCIFGSARGTHYCFICKLFSLKTLNLVACSIKVLGIFGDLLFGEFCGKSFQSTPVDDVNYYLIVCFCSFILVHTVNL